MSHEHHAAWPRFPEQNHRVACHFCDTLHDADVIEEGLAAHCAQCGHVLYRNRRNSLHRALAFGVTALCLIGLILIFPFISMQAAGNTEVVTVPGAILNLWKTNGLFIAASVVMFVIVLPIALVLLLIYLCLPLLFGKALLGSIQAMRLFQTFLPWVMVEVFFLGAIVSLLKLVKLADVTLGIGFWSTAALMVCLAGAVGGIDRTELWDRVELARNLKERRKKGA